MPIQEGNIKLLASQVMDDVPEGGGQATGTAIADGASNAIFPDISELDRAIGRVNLRKTYVSVDTVSRDSYYGANVIIADPPDDQRVSCTLFTTGSGFDRRTDAQSHLEAYVLSGPLSRMRVYGTQFVGQRAILAYQREEETLPEVGQVFVMSLENSSGTVSASQFVRVTEVSHEVRTFTDSNGDFSRRVITLGISDALRQTFPGGEPRRESTILYSYTQIRESQVADAAQYFSAVPLAEPITTGALVAKVDSIYTQLVPSSTTESPVSMAQISAALGVKDSAPSPVTESINVSLSVGTPETIRLLRGCKPGSLNANGGSLLDDGFGNLTGAWVNSAQPASIDYATGTITFTPATGASGSRTFTYTPVVEVSQAAHTNQIAVTLASRGSVYSVTLSPIPLPGTTVVDYMALGKWYRLRDNGTGVLAGDDPSVGTGSVNFTSGAVVVTLGALPDVGTSVMFAWGSPAHFEVLAGTASDAATKAVVNATLTNLPVVAGSVTATWYEGAVAKTATANAAGTFSGSGATGSVDHTTGVVRLELSKMPDTDGAVEFDYDQLVPTVPGTPTVVNAIISGASGMVLDLGGPVEPNGLTLSMAVVPNLYGAYGTITMTDDGAGSVVVKGGQEFGGSPLSTVSGNQIVGTINYATGEMTITSTVSCKTPVWENTLSSTTGGTADGGGFLSYKYTSEWVTKDGVVNLNPTVPFPVSRRTGASGTNTPVTDTLAAGAVTLGIDLTATKGYAVMPGSVWVRIGGRDYIDRSGTLYTDINPETGSGLAAGTVDYTSGVAALTLWNGNTTPAPDVRSCLTQFGQFTAVDASFRTSGAPLRPASFYVQVTDENGNTLSGTSNTSGVISGTKVRGTINHQTGVVFVEFGEKVTAAGNESEWWYDADEIDVDGKIWKPQRVLPSTIRYNCVVLSTLPLDASIIGIDPVRLPSDGRVPVLRPGNVAVVHHTASTAPATVTNGQTVNVGRVRLARVKVIGNDGNTITTGYTTDLDAGDVTFTDVTGYSQPVTIEHRIEDMALVSDAQISGDLRFTRQITHDYPLGSYVSSALIIGDMKSRVPVLFDQGTWSNAWSDSLSGSAATGTFNDVIAPVAVTNKGAITERWSLVFTSTTNFNILGEHVGLIGTGSIGADCSPMNPAAGVPYFTVPALGWGTGWAAGNALRFNTIGALYPVWIARTIQQGPATAPDDSFTVLIRGDIDRP